MFLRQPRLSTAPTTPTPVCQYPVELRVPALGLEVGCFRSAYRGIRHVRLRSVRVETRPTGPGQFTAGSTSRTIDFSNRSDKLPVPVPVPLRLSISPRVGSVRARTDRASLGQCALRVPSSSQLDAQRRVVIRILGRVASRTACVGVRLQEGVCLNRMLVIPPSLRCDSPLFDARRIHLDDRLLSPEHHRAPWPVRTRRATTRAPAQRLRHNESMLAGIGQSKIRKVTRLGCQLNRTSTAMVEMRNGGSARKIALGCVSAMLAAT